VREATETMRIVEAVGACVAADRETSRRAHEIKMA
jgi:hypothetical protein